MRLTLDGSWMGDIYYSYDGATYQKYLGLLLDLPKNDFTLYTYVQRQDVPGRVSKFTYKTTEVDPRVMEQLTIYGSVYLPDKTGLQDFRGDLNRAMSDDAFMRTMLWSSRSSIPAESISVLNEDELFSDTVISADAAEAYIQRVTCGHRKPVKSGEERTWYDAERDAYICPFDVPITVHYYDFVKTEHGFQIKALFDYNYGGPSTSTGETQTLSYGSTDWTCDQNTEILSMGLTLPTPAQERSEQEALSRELERYDRAIVVKNAERFLTPQKEGVPQFGWRELTFTEDPSGGIYLSGCKTLQ